MLSETQKSWEFPGNLGSRIESRTVKMTRDQRMLRKEKTVDVAAQRDTELTAVSLKGMRGF